MFFISIIVQVIANIAVKGIMKIAGSTLTPANAIAIIFATSAVISNERKISTIGATRCNAIIEAVKIRNPPTTFTGVDLL